jgi:hypothetical protein
VPVTSTSLRALYVFVEIAIEVEALVRTLCENLQGDEDCGEGDWPLLMHDFCMQHQVTRCASFAAM